MLFFIASLLHMRQIHRAEPDISLPMVQVADILATREPSSELVPAHAQYPEIAARPLFSRSRRPFMPPPQEIAEPAPPEPEQVATLGDPQIVLQGVMITDRAEQALILADGEAAPRWRNVGESVGGWTIAEIAENGVRLTAEQQSRTVNLYVEKPAMPDNPQ
jgi:hypothetical protein